MSYEENIMYNGKKYNTHRLLGALIKDGILKAMMMNERLLIKSYCEVYHKTPTEIKLSEFDHSLFELKQYTDISSISGRTCDIFYGDFE